MRIPNHHGSVREAHHHGSVRKAHKAYNVLQVQKREKTSNATRSIQEVYGNGMLNVRKCQRWLNKFRTGNCSMADAARTGCPVEFDNDLFLATLEEDCAVTVEELAQKLNLSLFTAHLHLQLLGRVSKLGKCVPHELSADNLRERVDISTSLHSRELQASFLNHLVAEDEK
ncbi:histone-lysine N-methyltransferase SETMAR-like [Tachypleus tridentatus]|uniref:histone-lysine N-methyltransferase SETMAR-like n=1 Tax=Tachypleus tridentatus TaxID=6853 RepID=UPI003FD2443A